MVAEAVGDTTTLELLHALVRADAAATGPAAWSSWKGRLVAELVARVRTALDTGVLPAPPAPDPALVAGPLPAVHLAGGPGGGGRRRPARAARHGGRLPGRCTGWR